MHESIAEDFINRVVEKTNLLRQKAVTHEDGDIGAMTNRTQLEIVEAHVKGAVENGARVLTGGKRAGALSGLFFEPTVLDRVDDSMTIMREETFGPVLPIKTFKSEEEALHLANDSSFGLTASVWTRNIKRGEQLAERIEAGTVMINEVLYTHGIAQTPWGGMKQSGLGRTHGRAGLLELVRSQHIHTNRLARFPDLWWFNYTPRFARLVRGLARRFASGSPAQTALALPAVISRFLEGKNKFQ